MTKITSQALSELFYTTDTYGQFSTELLDEDWFDESEFDGDGFMRDLAELHANVINSCLPAGGIQSVTVVGTSSPREYNFATDQVELEIEVDVAKLYRYLAMHDNEAQFEKFIKERFTSYDGFMSFTPNNLNDFYNAIDNEDNDDHEKCVGILVGWYLSRECMTEEQYLDEMYDSVHEIMDNNFEQFTTETWEEYNKYEDNFNRHKESQTTLTLVGCGETAQYPLEIADWYKEREEAKELEETSA